MFRIDPHVHCRDGEEAYKATVRGISLLAKDQGIVHICDMPNTRPPILREKDVLARLELVRKSKPAVGYSLFMYLTSERAQIEEAVRVVREYPEVVGFKLYPPANKKKRIYQTLAELGYTGVLAVHAEKASLFKTDLFDPQKPWTHNLAQPPKAEIESVKEQIKFARAVNFQGTLYICHVTLPESAEIIWRAKKYLRIYSEVTPHHLLFSDLRMREKDGLLWKVNPPLRDNKSARGLLKAVTQGKIDCLGTDFAPHALLEKLWPPYLSGIAIYAMYGCALDLLRKQGMSEAEIDNLTYWNIKEVFGDKLKDV